MRKPKRAAAPKPKPVNPGGPNKPAPSPQARAAARKRHLAAVKAAATRKKHAAAAKKKHVKPVRRLAIGEGVACCSAEALAASLRLAGWPVADADVLALYWRTASDPDAGASILATFEAAAEYGLAGARPLSFREVMPCAAGPEQDHLPGLCVTRAGLILGADLPGPHAVLDDGRWWWSWGESYDPAAFPDAVIEEAWAVTWP